ncbi:hypothetical protein COL26b_002007 [Colletotrichum chrysophilum]|uniref:uncharacterized protein n=1 Tax=Colletotrichum chrysophilum TaxID=1836956 RepID=UPI0023015BEA|nr:uncharacterized protein COL26b_002007 [Colletotrichum chrysophilum]KAJ0379854.1 hypothetical protein COL26b_002007 [Colletotrichum chrysophilum]
MESNSIYKALDPEDKQIRLIKVDSGLETAQITVTLEIASLKDEPSFAALSYVWGDPTITEEILANGHTSHVTNNLRQYKLSHKRCSAKRKEKWTFSHFWPA